MSTYARSMSTYAPGVKPGPQLAGRIVCICRHIVVYVDIYVMLVVYVDIYELDIYVMMCICRHIRQHDIYVAVRICRHKGDM